MNNESAVLTVVMALIQAIAATTPIAIAAYKGFVKMSQTHANSAAAVISAVVESVDRYHDLHTRQEDHKAQLDELKDMLQVTHKRIDDVYKLLIKFQQQEKD
ncbi:MAG: hypothetical protein JSS89_12200 [Bacteroidetes bacterium]|nr:hypothetical protein [Bacteroidota bacterium]